ncbi:MAG: hypothetical protein GVY36_17070 [Verrucomicrobia bacterium]|jgi:hypothetical protein|nr:hypothetical protein [Verrucomicrobiota bacterium]
MKPLAPKSSLLKSIEDKIHREGGLVSWATRTAGKEWIYITWFPTITNGLIFSDPNGLLEQDEPIESKEDAEHNLQIRISNAGDLEIGCGEGGGTYLETTIQSEWDLDEILDFYSNTRLKDEPLKLKSLMELTDEVFLYIPDDLDSKEPNPACLWKIKPTLLKKEHPELLPIISAFLEDDIDQIVENGFWHFGEYLSDKGFKDVFSNRYDLENTDIVIAGDGSTTWGSSILGNDDSKFGFEPAIVLRPKQNLSKIWLWDFLNFSSEGEEVMQRLLKGWQYLPKGLANIKINIPRSKTAQTADAIIRRNARQAYLHKLQSAMRIREPFSEMARLYKTRAAAADALHNEFLEEIVASQKPLPFFIEYPYRAFLKSDNSDKVKCSQRLLGIFAKIPLFLVIEELEAGGSPLGAEYLEKIKDEKPLSDGGFLNLQVELSKAIKASNPKLSIFSRLAAVLADSDSLKAMVAARNRMHHEPYDEEGFIEVMTKESKKLIDRYREAFSETNFVIPKGIRIEDGQTVLTAEDITGCDGFFRERDFPISASIETFENGKIVAFQKSGTQALKLSFLLNAQQKTKRITDFGIFDRMRPSGPEYTLLRD